MKILSTIEKISDAVNKVQKISGKHVSLPVLENVLITASENNITFRTTNLHVGVEVSVPVKVEQEGVVAVNVGVFSNIISSLKKKHNITLELKESLLQITTDDAEMELKTHSHEDFPTLPQPQENNFFRVPVEHFIEGIRSVIYSASQSDIRPEIASVYIYSDNQELVFVATDSFRLAEKRVNVKGMEDFPGVIVPVKNIQECIRVFTSNTGDIELYVEKNQLSIKSNNTYFTSRIIDGNYPDYQQIIPQEFNTEAVMLKEDLVQTLKLINIFSNTFNQISVKTLPKEGKVSVSSRNTDIGENTSMVDAAITGESHELFVNHRYISDIFNVIQGDSISFSILGKNKPFIIKGVGDTSFRYLIMPMNR